MKRRQIHRKLFGTLSAICALACPAACNLFPQPGGAGRLFVVNSLQGVTSYAGPASANGNAAPATNLPAGTTTDIFQPRGIVVTKDNLLIVSRGTGGLTVHADALNVSGDTPADRIVSGASTLLDNPVSLAYDKVNDRLFVGNATADQGILVFDGVGGAGFNGSVAPSRKFNPLDRAPAAPTPMSIAAMALDSVGRLYVADTSGLNAASSRLLVFALPGSAVGSISPVRTITSSAWNQIEDIAMDSADHLYVVDGGAAVLIFDGAAGLSGDITTSRALIVPGAGVKLRGLALTADGRAFVADAGNSMIHGYSSIATRLGAFTPDTTIAGVDTGLSSPRHMYLVEP